MTTGPAFDVWPDPTDRRTRKRDDAGLFIQAYWCLDHVMILLGGEMLDGGGISPPLLRPRCARIDVGRAPR